MTNHRPINPVTTKVNENLLKFFRTPFIPAKKNDKKSNCCRVKIS